MAAPTRSYLICSTPRSGSTLLCEALTNTGVAGAPEEYYQHRRKTGLPRRPLEYFEEVRVPEAEEILGRYTRVDDELTLFDPRRFGSYREYVDWTIARGTSPNGVFGAKVMWGYFNGFVDSLRDLQNNAVGSTRTVCEQTFPNLSLWVFMTRQDKVRQAVSLWKAIQNWTWRRDGGDGTLISEELVYSSQAIGHLVRQLEQHDREWMAFFGASGITPHVVVYEQLARDYQETAVGIVRALGIDPAEVAFGERRMSRQSDAVSDEWVARFKAESADPGDSMARPAALPG
jgi:trehalose 2-sulfotransferase